MTRTTAAAAATQRTATGGTAGTRRRRQATALTAGAALGLAGLTGLAAPPVQAQPAGTATAYVANGGDNTVSAVDTSDGTVTATIPVGSGPQGVAASPDGTRVYVPAISSNTVSVIDTRTNTVTATIPVAASPTAAVVTPDGSRVYVADLGAAAVSVIDTASGTVIATVPVGSGADAVAVSPDGSRVYATASSGRLSVIDTATDTVTATVPTGAFPIAVAVSPDGAHTYVANLGDSSVTVVDTATDAVGATLRTTDAPYALAVSPDGAHLYVAGGSAHNVSVLDPATGSVTAAVPVDTDPQALALTPDGGLLYVTGPGTPAAIAIDTATDAVAATTAVGHNPTGVGVSLLPLPAPVVTSVSPASGPPAGGATVTINGSHLKDASAVTFGPGHPATDVNCTDTACTAVVPAGAAGTVDVQVTTPGGTSAASAADRYTYAAADLGVSLAADAQPGLLGGRITYTLTITDHGPSDLGAATVTAVLPAPMRATSGDCQTAGSTVTCSVAGLAGGASTTRRFTVPVGLLGVGLPYTVTASRTTSSPVDLVPGNDRAASTCTVVTSLIISCR